MKIEFYISKNETRYVKRLVSKASGINKGLEILHRIAVFLSSFFIGFSLMQVIPHTMRVYSVFPEYIIALGILLTGISIYFLSKWYVGKKMIEKTGLQKAKVTYELLPDKIIHLTDDGLKQEVLPSEIKKFVDIKGYYLMFVRDNFAFYIPPSAFGDETARNNCKIKIEQLLKNA
jgi:hypothetical protein